MEQEVLLSPASICEAMERVKRSVVALGRPLRGVTVLNMLGDQLRSMGAADGVAMASVHAADPEPDPPLPPGCTGKPDCECDACQRAEEEDRRLNPGAYRA